MSDIQVGDVCLDLAQGRPVQVLESLDQSAGEWSDANNYELTENYGNARLGAGDDDAVFEVVYCSSAKSEPSKTYAFPESRLLRIETEAADDGRPVYDRVAIEVLSVVFEKALEPDQLMAKVHGEVPNDVLEVARELADVEQTIGGESGE